MKTTRNSKSPKKFKPNDAKVVRQLKKDRLGAIEGIKLGLESIKRNSGKPAKQFFREFFAEKGIAERE